MTDAQFKSAIDAIPATITALGVLLTTILVALARWRDQRADEKAEERDKTLTEIHTVTNSNLSEMKDDYKLALAELAAMKDRITAMDKAKDTADDVAKALADKVVAPTTGEPTDVRVVNTDKDRVPVSEESKPPTKPKTK